MTKKFDDLLQETRDNRQKVEKGLGKGHYDGQDGSHAHYKDKGRYGGSYNKFDGEEEVEKSQKKYYNADKSDKSNDHDGDYEGSQTTPSNDADHDRGYSEHPDKDAQGGKNWGQDDLDDLTNDDPAHKSGIESKEYKGYTKTRKKHESVESFDDFLKEEKELLDSMTKTSDSDSE